MNLLSPLGWVWSRVAGLRNSLYDRGYIRTHYLGARTISIGNLTVGGTGKTPITALVAEILAESGENVCILSRGYGRENPRDRVVVLDGDHRIADARLGGDEPVELARRLDGKAIIISDADRVGAANWARNEYACTAFVLDDGFQHRRAERAIDMLCIDATDPWGGNEVVPAGRLRESLSAIGRADAVVITRADMVESTDAIERQIFDLNPNIRIFRACFRLNGFVELDEYLNGPDRLKTVVDKSALPKPYVFCGLGNPGQFLLQLEKEGFNITGRSLFADHHSYDLRDAETLEMQAAETGAACLLTTAKDAVKLGGFEFSLPVFVSMLRTEINDEEGFRRLITASLSEDVFYRPSKMRVLPERKPGSKAR